MPIYEYECLRMRMERVASGARLGARKRAPLVLNAVRGKRAG